MAVRIASVEIWNCNLTELRS